jgi:hypothetical protein
MEAQEEKPNWRPENIARLGQKPPSGSRKGSGSQKNENARQPRPPAGLLSGKAEGDSGEIAGRQNEPFPRPISEPRTAKTPTVHRFPARRLFLELGGGAQSSATAENGASLES